MEATWVFVDGVLRIVCWREVLYKVCDSYVAKVKGKEDLRAEYHDGNPWPSMRVPRLVSVYISWDRFWLLVLDFEYKFLVSPRRKFSVYDLIIVWRSSCSWDSLYFCQYLFVTPTFYLHIFSIFLGLGILCIKRYLRVQIFPRLVDLSSCSLYTIVPLTELIYLKDSNYTLP